MINAATQLPQKDESGFLALMRHRNYSLLWTSQLISQLGTRLHWVAISLWVYSKTGSALSVSYAIMALMIAPAIVGLFAGALVDRFDRRKILIYGDLVRAVLVFAIPDLMSRGIAWVYLDLVLVSAASAFFRPAMFAIIPESVPKRSLLKANAFYASLESGTEVLGPAIAGMLVAKLGYAAGLYLDAVSYIASAILVSSLRLPTDIQRVNEGKSVSTIHSIQEGLRYVRADRFQLALLAFLFAGQWVVGLSSLQTPLAKGVLGISDRQFGWFQSVWGVGFIAASVFAGSYATGLPRGQAIVISYFLWALATGAMGLSGSYSMLLVTGFWVGFANILLFVNVGTLMMEHTPSDRIGRAITIRQVGLAVVRVTALLGFGWLADHSGTRTAIVSMAVISAAGTMVAVFRYPDLWRYRAEGSVWRTRASPASEVMPTPASTSVILRLLDSRSDPQFIAIEQRWLNGASIGIVGLGWLVFLLLSPARALWIAGISLGTVAVGVLARWVGNRFRAPPEGQE